MIQTLRIKFWERLALNAFATSRFDKARQAFEKILHLDPERQGVRYNLGLVQLSAKNFTAARDLFLEEQARHGDSLNVKKALAETAYRIGDRMTAQANYTAVAAMSHSQKEKAFCKQRAALCRDPESFSRTTTAHELLDQADGLLHKKDYDQAEKLFREACHQDPTCFQAFNNIGAIRLAQKDYPTARDFFLKADALVDMPAVTNNLKYIARKSFDR